ncbi:oxalurate catabolism protein HpxZ [Pseudomethylobacillus aquaticus]|uniref:oxalurate catabolism protein HpxZ n=1 Tax=Pseudomethylobacillus aquaticus TaxID=2676064 RepID=UPI0019609379|nr:oxalurate catabolism protein HpxZ [Pseudomethylobacillus aquaticus]
MLNVNLPETLASVTAAFEAYEAALMRNDVEALIPFFWQSPQAVRFGATENLYGWDAIVNFRQNRQPPLPRTLMNTVITTFGEDYANISTEYRNSAGVCGRQMQSWVRTDAGWRIAAAHISLRPEIS